MRKRKSHVHRHRRATAISEAGRIPSFAVKRVDGKLRDCRSASNYSRKVELNLIGSTCSFLGHLRELHFGEWEQNFTEDIKCSRTICF